MLKTIIFYKNTDIRTLNFFVDYTAQKCDNLYKSKFGICNSPMFIPSFEFKINAEPHRRWSKVKSDISDILCLNVYCAKLCCKKVKLDLDNLICLFKPMIYRYCFGKTVI